jgi:hypothetical protein
VLLSIIPFKKIFKHCGSLNIAKLFIFDSWLIHFVVHNHDLGRWFYITIRHTFQFLSKNGLFTSHGTGPHTPIQIYFLKTVQILWKKINKDKKRCLWRQIIPKKKW